MALAFGAFANCTNLYPVVEKESFSLLSGTLADSTITFSGRGVHQAFAKPVDAIKPDTRYTYVFEVLELVGTAEVYIGQTDKIKAQLPWTHLTVTQTGANFLTMTSKSAVEGEYDFLDRLLVVGSSDGFKMRARISLFEGTSVNSGNFTYVASGEELSNLEPIKVIYTMPSGWVAAVRYARSGRTYGESINIYPNSGEYVFSGKQYHSFVTAPLDGIVPGATYTYVLEVLSLSAPCTFYMGQTDVVKAQLPWTSQTVYKPGIYILEMKAQPEQETYDFFDRGLVVGKKGAVDVTFRVSVFGGTGVTAENYSYVECGNAIDVGMQELPRDDVEFLGWFDETTGNQVEASDIVPSVSEQVLTCKWKVPGSGESLVALDEARQTGWKLLNITTEDGVEPSCDRLDNPLGLGSVSINAENVKSRLTIEQNGELLYDSGEYVKGKSGLTVKVRGNTSSREKKKPFKLKLQKKADLLFRGDSSYQDKEWLLLIPPSGRAYSYWIGFSMSEYIGMPYTPGMEFVHVAINGDYRGMYMLCESVEQNNDCRIDVDKKNGFICEYDGYYWAEDVAIKTENIVPHAGYTFKLPDPEDITEAQIFYASNLFERLEASISDGTYDKVLDVESWAKWLLIQDCIGNGDYVGSNIYLAKYSQAEDEKIFMPCIWDLDGVMSRHVGDDWSPIHTAKNWFFFDNLLNNNNQAFLATYCHLWKTKGLPAFDRMIADFEALKGSDEAKSTHKSRKLDKRRWGTRIVAAEADIAQCIDWLKHRRDWLAQHIAETSQNLPVITVNFDANGGRMPTTVRHIRTGDTLDANINLYPSNDGWNFTKLTAELENNVFSVNVDNTSKTTARTVQIASKPLQTIVPGLTYGYYLEALEVEGSAKFYTGRTDKGGYQLSRDNFTVDAPGLYAFAKSGLDVNVKYKTDDEYLERMFIIINPGEKFQAKFRVSLYAGDEICEDDFVYAEPGEGVRLGFPVPIRDGYVFEGWTNGGKIVEEDSSPNGEEDITLVAKWRLERPIVGLMFDPNGGTMQATIRYIRTGDTLDANINLYPSNDGWNFTKLTAELENNVFSVNVDNTSKTTARTVQIASKPLQTIVPGLTYGYYLEALEVEGSAKFYTGRTDKGGYQLSRDNFTVDAPGLYAFAKSGLDVNVKYKTDDEYLERMFIIINPGEKFQAKFRVSLYAGDEICEDDFVYAEPGEGVRLGLPVPERDGFEFQGWYYDGELVDADTIVDLEDDIVLVAGWNEYVEPTVLSNAVDCVVINEVMSNPSDEGAYDWVELHNTTNIAVDISGWRMIDSLTKKWKNWQVLPEEVVIPADGYLLILCDKNFEATGWDYDNNLCLQVSLSSAGEAIAIATGDFEDDHKLAEDEFVDGWEFPGLPADVSYGRGLVDDTELLYFTDPTPGAENSPDGVYELNQ